MENKSDKSDKDKTPSLTSIKKIPLTDALSFLDSKEENNLPLLFIDPKGDLLTFFNYKGKLREIYKLQMKLILHPEEEEKIEEDLHSIIEIGMRNGSWVVFDLGMSSNFNIKEFFQRFSWFEEKMFLPENIHNKKYCLEHNILREENDIGYFGNKGTMIIQEKFKIIFLSECAKKNIEKLIECNKSLGGFNIIVIENGKEEEE